MLAASRGTALGELTANRPKAMVEVRGQPLLGHSVAAYNAAGVKNITVVRGYLPEAFDLPALTYVDNPDYADTNELLSLKCALDATDDDNSDLYVSFGDVIFRRYIVDSLAEADDDIVIAVDTDWHESVNRGRAADYVHCSEPHSRQAFYHQVLLERAGEDLDESDIHGEWMGIVRFANSALPAVRDLIDEMASDPANRAAKLHHLFDELVRRGHRIRVIYTTGHWLDVDSLDDVLAAGAFA